MLSINLLPPGEKQMIRMREAAETVGFLAMLALFALAVGLFLLLPSFFLVHFTVRELERSHKIEQRETVQRRQVRAALAKARTAHEAIGEIKAYAARTSGVSLSLKKFFSAGEGIAITSLDIRSDGGVTVNGRAGTRGQLLDFEETLRASDQFLEVSFPLEDIVRERNIQFSAKAKLKPAYQF